MLSWISVLEDRFYFNSVDPDEMQLNAAFHLGLHCQSNHFGVSSIQSLNNMYADHISIFNNIRHILMLNKKFYNKPIIITLLTLLHLRVEGQWLRGRVLDSKPKGRGFEPHRRHCVVILEHDTLILAYYWFNPGRPLLYN